MLKLINSKKLKTVTAKVKLPVSQDVNVVLGLSVVHPTVELGVVTLGMQFPLGARLGNTLHSSSTSTAHTEANKQATRFCYNDHNQTEKFALMLQPLP